MEVIETEDPVEEPPRSIASQLFKDDFDIDQSFERTDSLVSMISTGGAGSGDFWDQELGGVDVEKEEQLQEEAEVDFESLPGWNECLHTSMATAAHHAAFYGFMEVLEMLSKHFDVFAMDKNGRTPLFYASLRNNLDCVLLLVALGRSI